MRKAEESWQSTDDNFLLENLVKPSMHDSFPSFSLFCSFINCTLLLFNNGMYENG